MREREGLIARIRQIRRASADAEYGGRPPKHDSEQDELRALKVRLADLEQLVQGLQDSVHRETTRLSKRITELEAQVQPAALGKAISDDARRRGLA